MQVTALVSWCPALPGKTQAGQPRGGELEPVCEQSRCPFLIMSDMQLALSRARLLEEERLLVMMDELLKGACTLLRVLSFALLEILRFP